MEKKTGEEILQIIRENYDESAFAYNEWRDLLSDELSNEVPSFEEEEKAKDDYYDSIRDTRTDEEMAVYRSMPGRWELQNQWILNRLGLGRVVEVDQHGGEGEGERWWSVKHFVDHDVYIRIDGFYQSYNGTEFYSGHGKVVQPAQKTITVFE